MVPSHDTPIIHHFATMDVNPPHRTQAPTTTITSKTYSRATTLKKLTGCDHNVSYQASSSNGDIATIHTRLQGLVQHSTMQHELQTLKQQIEVLSTLQHQIVPQQTDIFNTNLAQAAF